MLTDVTINVKTAVYRDYFDALRGYKSLLLDHLGGEDHEEPDGWETRSDYALAGE